jgi:pimeloyl-ACP methyl ester carboxylesterase
MTNSVSRLIFSERDDAPPHRNLVVRHHANGNDKRRVALSVREYGSRDAADTVVLLHGFCLNKDSWTIQIDHLLDEYDSIRIISYDHRGHCDSAATPMHTYHIDRLAAGLADLLVAFGIHTRLRKPLQAEAVIVEVAKPRRIRPIYLQLVGWAC